VVVVRSVLRPGADPVRASSPPGPERDDPDWPAPSRIRSPAVAVPAARPPSEMRTATSGP
jgi:hypothetical protein